MAKKYTDVYTVDGICNGTKGNDIFHITTDDVSAKVTASKGSDILLLENFSAENLENLQFTQKADESGLTKDLVITTGDGRTVVLENYFTNTTGNATKSSVKTLRVENGLAQDGETKLYKDFNILDMCVIDYNSAFTPKGNKVTGTVFNDKIDMSEQTKKLTINGGNGNDTITGGKGNDTIIGNKGSNTFIYNEGSGNDTVKLTKGENLTIKYISENATADNFSFTQKGKDVVISRTYIDGETVKTDKITVKNMTKNNLAESVTFELGATPDTTTPVFDLRNDYYIIDNGKKKATGTNLNEMIYGTLANNTIKGNGGNDVIDAGLGNDKLYGGAGNDTFVFGTYELNGKFYGSGKDTIYDVTGEDTLRFVNTKAEDLVFTQNKKDLVITYFDKEDVHKTTTENTVTIKNYYDKNGNVIRDFKIEALDEFGALTAAGDAETVRTVEYKESKAEAREESGYLIDTEKLENYDTLTTEAKDRGYDTAEERVDDLQGEVDDYHAKDLKLMNNTHTFSFNEDGNPTLSDYTTEFEPTTSAEFTPAHIFTPFESDTTDDILVFDKSSFKKCKFTSDGNDLTIEYFDNVDNTGNSGKLTIKDYFATPENRINNFVDKDGKTHSLTDIANLFIYGEDNAETPDNIDVNSNIADANIQLKKGDDTVNLNSSLDNTLVFTTGDGNDTVYTTDNAQTHTLKFNDVKFENVRFHVDENDSNDLVVSYGEGDSVRLDNWFATADGSKIDTVVDSTGAEYSILSDGTIYMDMNGNETLNVTKSNLTVNGSDSDDTINLNSGNNIVYGGDGNDVINVNGSNNRLLMTKGRNTVTVNRGNNTIHGGDGVDTIEVKANGNNIYGEGGDDVVNLNSTSGNTLNFSVGDGVDTVDCDNVDNVLNFSNTKFEDMTICVDPTNSANLKISYSDDGTVILKDWFNKNVDERIDTIVDSQGESYSIVADAPDYNKYFGTPEANTMVVNGQNEIVLAGDGDDTVNVNADNNSIYVGKDDDTVNLGETSNNTLFFTSQDGADTVTFTAGENAATNTLNFTDTKLSDMVVGKVEGTNDLRIYYNNNLDFVTIKDWFATTTGNRVDKIVDSSGEEFSIVRNTSYTKKIKILTNGNDTETISSDTIVFALDGNDTLTTEYYKNNIIVYSGKGNDTIKFNIGTDNCTFVFALGDGQDFLDLTHFRNNNKIIFTDVKIADMNWIKDNNKLSLQYSETDVIDFGTAAHVNTKQHFSLMDSTGVVTYFMSRGYYTQNQSFSLCITDNRLIFDFFTTDNDTLTISDTNADALHVVANFKADGTLDGNGLRVISDDNYTAWKSDTTSVTGGVQVVSELGSIENIASADGFTVTATELDQLKTEVVGWFTSHTDYADVAEAIANQATDTEVADLVAIFDNFNTQAWAN